MDIPLIVVAFLLVALFAISIYSIYKIRTDKGLTQREKDNLTFLQVYLPVIGAVYYFCFYKNRRNENHSNRDS